MSRSALAAALMLALAACGAGAGASATGASTSHEWIRGNEPSAPGIGSTSSDAAAAARFVLVRDDAWLYSDATDTALRARAAPRLDDADDVSTFRLVRELGAWLEVESIDSSEEAEHCYAPPPRLAPLALRLFVRRGGVAPVTTRELVMRYDDGTSITLGAGVVAIARETPRGADPIEHMVDTPRVRFEARLPPDAIGASYALALHNDRANDSGDPSTGLAITPGASLSFDRARTLRVEEDAPAPLYVQDVRDDSSAKVVTFADGCGRYAARARTEDVFDISTLGGATSEERSRAVLDETLDTPRQRRPVVRAGAPIYWPDGRVAGSVRRDDSLEADADTVGARRCFWRSLRTAWPASSEASPSSQLKLCFDAPDVRQVPASTPSHRTARATDITGSI